MPLRPSQCCGDLYVDGELHAAMEGWREAGAAERMGEQVVGGGYMMRVCIYVCTESSSDEGLGTLFSPAIPHKHLGFLFVCTPHKPGACVLELVSITPGLLAFTGSPTDPVSKPRGCCVRLDRLDYARSVFFSR